MPKTNNASLYDRVIVEVFNRHDGANQQDFEFKREEFTQVLGEWGEQVKNLGDITYSYRGGRRYLPDAVSKTGNWVIEGRGKGVYAFRRLKRSPYIILPPDLKTTKILDATPDIILKYGSNDEQGLLTRVHYNRLVDTFLGITAYHLQGHCRAYVTGCGQVEVDDLYLGVDTNGKQYVVPVEGKTQNEPLGIIQIVNMSAYARQKFPGLILRPLAIKPWNDGSIYFVEFTDVTDPEDIEVADYRRYRLVRESTQQPTLYDQAPDVEEVINGEEV